MGVLLKLVPPLVVVLTVLVGLSWANDWPPTRPARRWWSRHDAVVRWYVTSAPATFVYLAILGVTTWVLLGMPEVPRRLFIENQSTNLRELSTNPLRVLVRSAFFVTNAEFAWWVALFAMLLAPTERWLGSARAIAVFVVGHVGATLIAAVDVWVHITYRGAPESLMRVQDTGASYGFACLAALSFYRLRGVSRAALGAVLLVVVVYGAIEGTGFTARGHAVAVLLGLALLPVVHSPAVRERQSEAGELWRLWLPATADGPPAPAVLLGSRASRTRQDRPVPERTCPHCGHAPPGSAATPLPTASPSHGTFSGRLPGVVEGGESPSGGDELGG